MISRSLDRKKSKKKKNEKQIPKIARSRRTTKTIDFLEENYQNFCCPAVKFLFSFVTLAAMHHEIDETDATRNRQAPAAREYTRKTHGHARGALWVALLNFAARGRRKTSPNPIKQGATAPRKRRANPSKQGKTACLILGHVLRR